MDGLGAMSAPSIRCPRAIRDRAFTSRAAQCLSRHRHRKGSEGSNERRSEGHGAALPWPSRRRIAPRRANQGGPGLGVRSRGSSRGRRGVDATWRWCCSRRSAGSRPSSPRGSRRWARQRRHRSNDNDHRRHRLQSMCCAETASARSSRPRSTVTSRSWKTTPCSWPRGVPFRRQNGGRATTCEKMQWRTRGPGPRRDETQLASKTAAC